MQASIIVPSRECQYLKYLLRSLRYQTVKPYEIILVIKECNTRAVENLCREHNLPCVVIEQKEGYFTHALNIGKKEAHGDIIVFTDDDAIAPRRWLERWTRYHRLYRTIAGISSRDIHLNLNRLKVLPTPDDRPSTRLYRWFIRPWLEQPHPLFAKYRLGVYLTKTLEIAHGPYIPYRTCYSLPFRGVNMSFKNEYVYDVWFPEHPELKIAPGNEQYFGIQLILKSHGMIYVPSNPILHIAHRSLSRSRDEIRSSRIKYEMSILKKLLIELLKKSSAL